jgi:hypothetical protein
MLDGLDSVHEHVPKQEDQDPGRQRAQCSAEASAWGLDAAEGQAEEDRESGDRAENEDLCLAHELPVSLRWL